MFKVSFNYKSKCSTYIIARIRTGILIWQTAQKEQPNNKRDREGKQQSPISPSKELFCASAEDSKWRPGARVYLFCPLMNLVILSWMKISVLRCTSSTKVKENCEERKCICFFYIELAWLEERWKKGRKKKRKKKICQIGIFDHLWRETAMV